LFPSDKKGGGLMSLMLTLVYHLLLVLVEEWDACFVAVVVAMFILFFMGAWQLSLTLGLLFTVVSILLFFKRRCSHEKR